MSAVPSLRDEIGSQVVRLGLNNKDKDSTYNVALFAEWESIRTDPSLPKNIKREVVLIEKRVLDDHQWDSGSLLVREVNRLFMNLSLRSGVWETSGGMVPVTKAYYLDLGQRWADEALSVLWKAIGREIALPRLRTAQAVRSWLKDAQNAESLSQIVSLDLSSKDLKIFPSEVKFCTGLQKLDLSMNQIVEISEDLNLLRLEWLDLNNNKILELPVLNLPQLQRLDLNNNRLSGLSDMNLPQLQWLSLNNNQITCLTDMNLSQLQGLYLSDNKIVNFPALNAPLLQELYLSNNKITSFPVLNAPQLREFFLSGNEISILPDLHLPQLQELLLDDNLLLFIFDQDKNYLNRDYCTTALDQFKNYICGSKLARFLQSIGLDHLDAESMKSAFYDLEKRDQYLVFEMVREMSNTSSIDPLWGQQHVFDDRHLFYKAVRKAVSNKFDRLSSKSKEMIYEKICEPALNLDQNAAKEHAFGHILRLIDAMASIESQD